MLAQVGQRPGSEVDTFNITPSGSDNLKITYTASKRSKLSQYVIENVETTVGSDFALILQLSKQGWEFRFQPPSKKVEPYKDGSEKVWFFHQQNRKGGINNKYLTALIQSESLFKRGLCELYHYQLKVYYAALLTVTDSDLAQILPWQPRSYYQLFLQKMTKTGKKKRKPTTLFTEDVGQMFHDNNNHNKTNPLFVLIIV